MMESAPKHQDILGIAMIKRTHKTAHKKHITPHQLTYRGKNAIDTTIPLLLALQSFATVAGGAHFPPNQPEFSGRVMYPVPVTRQVW